MGGGTSGGGTEEHRPLSLPPPLALCSALCLGPVVAVLFSTGQSRAHAAPHVVHAMADATEALAKAAVAAAAALAGEDVFMGAYSEAERAYFACLGIAPRELVTPVKAARASETDADSSSNNSSPPRAPDHVVDSATAEDGGKAAVEAAARRVQTWWRMARQSRRWRRLRAATMVVQLRWRVRMRERIAQEWAATAAAAREERVRAQAATVLARAWRRHLVTDRQCHDVGTPEAAATVVVAVAAEAGTALAATGAASGTAAAGTAPQSSAIAEAAGVTAQVQASAPASIADKLQTLQEIRRKRMLLQSQLERAGTGEATTSAVSSTTEVNVVSTPTPVGAPAAAMPTPLASLIAVAPLEGNADASEPRRSRRRSLMINAASLLQSVPVAGRDDDDGEVPGSLLSAPYSEVAAVC